MLCLFVEFVDFWGWFVGNWGGAQAGQCRNKSNDKSKTTHGTYSGFEHIPPLSAACFLELQTNS